MAEGTTLAAILSEPAQILYCLHSVLMVCLRVGGSAVDSHLDLRNRRGLGYLERRTSRELDFLDEISGMTATSVQLVSRPGFDLLSNIFRTATMGRNDNSDQQYAFKWIIDGEELLRMVSGFLSAHLGPENASGRNGYCILVRSVMLCSRLEQNTAAATASDRSVPEHAPGQRNT